MNLTKTLFALLLLAFLMVYHLWGYLGHFGYDDMYYARFVNDLAQGKLVLGIDHFAYRWGIVAPVALVFTGALALIYRYRFEQQQKAAGYAFALAACLLFGHLAK